jgi:hypothetical protein
MSSSPDPQEYEATEAEKTEARVGAEKAQHFNANYAPLNVDELNDSMSDDVKNLARGRGNADVMQGLTSGLTYARTQNAGDYASTLSNAYQGTLGQATTAALDIQNKRGAAGVGVAQGQTAQSAKAGSVLTDLGTNRTLDRAKNKLLVDNAKLQAAGKLVSGALDGASKNKDGSTKDNKWAQGYEVFKDAYKAQG